MSLVDSVRFPLQNMTSSSVTKCLSALFAIFGTPDFFHYDRSTQFESSEFQNVCHQSGVATSNTTPQHPQGNGQNERNIRIVWKAVECLLQSANCPLFDCDNESYHRRAFRSRHLSIPSPRRVPMTASFVSNAATR